MYATTNYNPNHMARAAGRDLGISTKVSIEICNFLRHKTTAKARAILNRVLAKEEPIPMKRFKSDRGHKPGMAAGRYPMNACKEFVKLLDTVEANAQFKGLSTANLKIGHICANSAGSTYRYGRHRGRKAKRTHLQIVVEEQAVKETVKTKPALDRKSEKKVEEKKEEVKEKPKAEEKKEEVKEKKEEKPVAEKKEEKAEVKTVEVKPEPKAEEKSVEEQPKEEKKEMPKQETPKEKPAEKAAEPKKETSEAKE